MIGMWASVLVSVAFIGGYAFAVAKETRQLSDALAETELVLAREQHLSALDGLAAAAAHELGTPLATIAIVVRELEREVPPDSPHRQDIALLREQSERCRSILRTLTSLGSGDAPFDRMPLSHLLEEVIAPHQPFGVAIQIETPASRAANRSSRAIPRSSTGSTTSSKTPSISRTTESTSLRTGTATRWPSS